MYMYVCMTTLLTRIYIFFFMICLHRTRKGNEKVYVDKRTPAQMQMATFLKKASKTHKRRVEVKHFDIPKVSWTK
uniref:Uncharacterized protein n=1 Tax=Sinocyclocheilus grahami TaxID=75366 RepID=A0A672LF96_SINGR